MRVIIICEYCTVYITAVVPLDEKGLVHFCIIRKLNELITNNEMYMIEHMLSTIKNTYVPLL